jgi:hypothetical protein
MKFRIATLIVTVEFAAGLCHAQGTLADYERGQKLQTARAEWS